MAQHLLKGYYSSIGALIIRGGFGCILYLQKGRRPCLHPLTTWLRGLYFKLDRRIEKEGCPETAVVGLSDDAGEGYHTLAACSDVVVNLWVGCLSHLCLQLHWQTLNPGA